MNITPLSIRPFIGSKDFKTSRSFYLDVGFQETVISQNLSLFQINGVGFYLQDAYVKDWIDNTMVFFEVADAYRFWNELKTLNLTSKYTDVRLVPVKELDWGRECFLHDPSGILLHFGEFRK